MNEEERRKRKKKKRRRKIRLYIRRTVFLFICVGLIGGIYFLIDHFLIDGVINGRLEKNENSQDSTLISDGDNNNSMSRDELIHSGTICDGIYLDEVDVSGLNYDEAVEAYEKYLKDMGKLKLVFKDNLGTYSTTFSEAGLKVDYESVVCDALMFGKNGNILNRYKEIQMLKSDHITLTPEKTIDEEKLIEMLTDEADDMKKTPVSSTMTRSDGNFVVYPSEEGLGIDYEKTIVMVNKVLEKTWKQKDVTIAAVTEVIEPAYSEEDFYGVDSLLGRAVTDYNQKNKDRIGNLIVGTSKIADNVVLPGQQFSVYDTVAPFTEENGYLNAGQYINAELVDGMGGGICQVATTLYDAVLEAELQVDERYPHSMTVSYVEKGMDAAIAEGYEDFKFTNNTEYPIYIDAYAGGGSISVAIYGHETRAANRRISFESQVIDTYEPGEDKTIYDDTLPVGTTNVTEAHTGYYVEVWKHIYVDGEEEDSVKVNGSQYSAIPKTTRIGTMSR